MTVSNIIVRERDLGMEREEGRRTDIFHDIRFPQEGRRREITAFWEDHAVELSDRKGEDCGYEGERELWVVVRLDLRYRSLRRKEGEKVGERGHTKIIVTIVKTKIVLDCSPEEIASLRFTRASST
jgi:hypothetical protein